MVAADQGASRIPRSAQLRVGSRRSSLTPAPRSPRDSAPLFPRFRAEPSRRSSAAASMRPAKEPDAPAGGFDAKLNEGTVTQLAIVLSFFFGQATAGEARRAATQALTVSQRAAVT